MSHSAFEFNPTVRQLALEREILQVQKALWEKYKFIQKRTTPFLACIARE